MGRFSASNAIGMMEIPEVEARAACSPGELLGKTDVEANGDVGALWRGVESAGSEKRLE